MPIKADRCSWHIYAKTDSNVRFQEQIPMFLVCRNRCGCSFRLTNNLFFRDAQLWLQRTEGGQAGKDGWVGEVQLGARSNCTAGIPPVGGVGQITQ